MNKVIVAGSRNIDDKEIVKKAIRDSPHSPFNGELVVGDADGVDEIAKEYLRGYRHVDINEFEADWDQYGSSAGPIRNREMAEHADALIAVWDGESFGTKNMIKIALENNLDVYVKVVETEKGSILDY